MGFLALLLSLPNLIISGHKTPSSTSSYAQGTAQHVVQTNTSVNGHSSALQAAKIQTFLATPYCLQRSYI